MMIVRLPTPPSPLIRVNVELGVIKSFGIWDRESMLQSADGRSGRAVPHWYTV